MSTTGVVELVELGLGSNDDGARRMTHILFSELDYFRLVDRGRLFENKRWKDEWFGVARVLGGTEYAGTKFIDIDLVLAPNQRLVSNFKKCKLI